MNRTTLGLATITVTTILLAGCGSDNGSKQDESTEGAEATNTQTHSEDAEEQKAAKSHDTLGPEDYSDRLLSLADVPDTLSMEEEGQFGEPVEGLSSDNSGREEDRSLAECAMNQYATVVREAPETTAYRTFSESSQTGSLGIVTSLSTPVENPDTVKDSIDSAISECILIDPKVTGGNPIESVNPLNPAEQKAKASAQPHSTAILATKIEPSSALHVSSHGPTRSWPSPTPQESPAPALPSTRQPSTESRK